MAQGHGRVEVQAAHQPAEDDDQRQLRQHQVEITHVEAHGGQHPAQLLQAGEAGQQLGQIHLRQVHHRKPAQQHDDQVGGQQPDQGDDQLGPDQGVDAGRQGVHQIALVCQQILMEADDHDDDGHQLRRHHGDEGGDQHQDQQNGQKRAEPAVQQADGEVRQQHQHRQHAQRGQHDAPGGAKFVFDELS